MSLALSHHPRATAVSYKSHVKECVVNMFLFFAGSSKKIDFCGQNQVYRHWSKCNGEASNPKQFWQSLLVQ